MLEKNKTASTVIITSLIWAVIAGAIMFHVVSNKNQYLQGYKAGGSAVKSILINK